MDVPSREEFEKQKSLLEALCRYLKIIPTSCSSHTAFQKQVEKAIRNDEPLSWECTECGFSYYDKYSIVFSKE